MTSSPSDHEDYQLYIENLSIEAPKVKIVTTEDMQRGLVATDTIYEGERIMFVPSTSLIDEDMLRQRGSYLLLRDDICEDLLVADETSLELTATGLIEEIRQLLLDENSILWASACQFQYQWRGDDAVALFLIACKYVLDQRNKDQENPNEYTDVTDGLMTDASQFLNCADEVERNLSEPENPPLVETMPDECFDPLTIVESSEPVVEIFVDPYSTGDESVVVSFPSLLQHVERLPKEFPHSPLYFSDEELARIEGTNCHGFATRMKQQIESDYTKLAQVLTLYNSMAKRKIRCQACQVNVREYCWCQVLDPKRIFNLESYKWALCNVYSRSTDFEWCTDEAQKQHRRVIAPLFDMMNHDFASTVTHAMDNAGNLSVFNGSTQIQPGDEVFLNYGNFPNEKFLLVYGFCIPQNPYNAVQIYAPISPQDPLFHAKTRILASRCGIQDVNAPHPLHHQGRGTVIPPSLFAVLRLIGVQSADELLSITHQEGNGIGMISPQNEMGALQALQSALHVMARHLALNMISDDGLHAASTVPRQIQPKNETISSRHEGQISASDINIQNCKVLCQGEYAILQAALGDLSEKLKNLDEILEGYQ